MPKTGFEWDDEKTGHLRQMFNELRKTKTTTELERCLAETFSQKYNCALAGSTLRQKAYLLARNDTVTGRPVLFEWNDDNEEFLLEIFLEQPQGLSVEAALTNIRDKFADRYPECCLAASSLQRHAYRLIENSPSFGESSALDETNFPASTATAYDFAKECMRYLRFGLKLSSQRLYTNTCSNCGVLISARRGRRRHYSSDDGPATVEKFFDVNTIPPFRVTGGKNVVCSKCASDRTSPLESYSVAKPGQKHTIPAELSNLNTQEKCDLALTGLFSRTHKPKSRLFGVYKQTRGEYNCLHKDDLRYGDLHALIISNEKAVPRNKKRLFVALHFLKKNNPLYKDFFSNYETLFRFYKPKPGDPSFVPVYGNDFTPQYLTNKKQLLENEKSKLALLIPSHDILEDNPDPYSSVREIQHPKIELLQAELNHIFQTYLGYLHPTLEPKTWPYLFPYGVGGHVDSRRWAELAHCELSFKDYVYWRILNAWHVFRNEQSYIFVMLDKMIKLDIMGFNYVRRVNAENQVRKLTVKDIVEDDRNPYNRYGTSVPKSIKNSSNFWQSKFRELLALASEYERPPDAFITLTQNDSWPEVQAFVFGGALQDPPQVTCHDVPLSVPHGKTFPVDNPVEVSLAFYRRLAEFFGLVVHNKDGIFGEFTDYWARVELQQRGGLHLHFVGWTKKPIDDLVIAEMPRENDIHNDYYRQLVSKFQTHSCREKCRVGPKGRRLANCKYGFPFTPNADIKLDDTRIRYLYRRNQNEDRNIASYNLPLLLLWQGHVNVQKVTENGWKMYLTKYIAKPEKAENIAFANRANPPSAPERFLRTRVCVSTEAAAILTKEKFVFASRLFVFCTSDLKAKRTLKRKEHMPLDSTSTDVYYKNQLDHYLDRPHDLAYLTYDQYNRQYYFLYVSGRKQLTCRKGCDAVPVYWNYAPYGKTQEEHFFQKYLLNKPVTRASLKTVIAVCNVTKTYLEQCLLDNITTEREEAEDYLKKSVSRGFTIDKLRALAETLSRENLIEASEVEELLRTVAPEHEDIVAALCENIDDDDGDDDERNVARGNNATEDFLKHFTTSQRHCYDFIVRKISRHGKTDTATGPNQVLALITGEAGVGKSFMLKALECLCKERGLAYRTLATTGVAAHLIGGQTIHSAFRLNVETLRSSIAKGEMSSCMIASLHLLFIDEFSMLTLDVFSAVDEICRRFASTTELQQRPFGGKTVIMFGDVLQLESIGRGIFVEDVLKSFDIIVLKEKCRQSDPDFIDLLNSIRIGELSDKHRQLLESKVVLPHRLPNPDDDDVMFLVPLRAQRDQINLHMLNKLDGDMFTFEANDFEPNRSKASETVKAAIRRTRTEKYFPSKLLLKKNAKVMLTRNRDISRGWCNGTVCRIKTISTKPEFIIVESLGNRKALLEVQRTAHTFKLGKSSTECTREQFPLVPCYSTTIHKAQGSTLQKVVIACNGMFASGAFYTALSRATTLDNIALTDFDDSAVYCNQQFVQLWSWLQSRDVISTTDTEEVAFPSIEYIPQKFSDLDVKAPMVTLPASFQSQPQCFKRRLDSSGSEEEIPSQNSSNKAPSSSGSLNIKFSSVHVDESRNSGLNCAAEKNAIQNCLAKIRKSYERGKRGSLFFDDVARFLTECPTLTVHKNRMLNEETRLFSSAHPKDSFADFYQQFKSVYAIRSTRGDGNCCFRSISHALFGHDEYYPSLRLLAVRYLLQHRDHYWMNRGAYDILSDDPREILEMDEHLYNSSFPNDNAPVTSWGSASHLNAICNELGRPIMTFRHITDDAMRRRFNPRFVTIEQASEMISSDAFRGIGYLPIELSVPARQPIKLYYTGNHYAPLLRYSSQSIALGQDLIAGGMLMHNPNVVNVIDPMFVLD